MGKINIITKFIITVLILIIGTTIGFNILISKWADEYHERIIILEDRNRRMFNILEMYANTKWEDKV